MGTSALPFGVVALSACSYTLLFRTVRIRSPPSSATHARAQLKAISAGHAALMAVLATIVLRQPQWTTPALPPSRASTEPTQDGNLADSGNWLIQGRSRLANSVTAWEMGYLLYDTWAMSRALPKAPTSPVFMTHHVLLVSALLCLQVFIARAKERGLWVITAFLLMNVTNPLLHARWWLRKKGKDSFLADVVFCAAFAASRFGIVAWVLQRYGAYHALGPLEAFKRLRLPCKAGTATLVGLNGLWWIVLAKGAVTRCLAGYAPGGAERRSVDMQGDRS